MKTFDYTFSINRVQIPVSVHQHEEDDKTYYDILFGNHTVTIYKDTLYTWTSDDPQEFNQAEIQSLGEQIDNPQP